MIDWFGQFYQKHPDAVINGFFVITAVILTWFLSRFFGKKKETTIADQGVKQDGGTGNTAIQNARDVNVDQSKNKDQSVHIDKSTHIEKLIIESEKGVTKSSEVMPKPPKEYIAHPYPLQENFTSRDAERKMLSEWFLEGDKPMLCLIAIGGMGKSSLAWQWLQEDIIGQGRAVDGLIWWSFYEKDAGFDSFVHKTLAYVSGAEPQKDKSLREKMDDLYQILCQKRFLIILDGVERLLRHYARLDAAYLKDEEADEAGDQKFRSCADPHVYTFLQELANKCCTSRTLITSRLYPLELEGLEGCRREDLTEFTLPDAHLFFERQGLNWTRAEVAQVCKPYGYLPLSLRLLTGAILHDPVNPGKDTPPASEIIKRLKGKSQHILELAYDSLSKEEQGFLSRIAAFRSPMDYEAISAISETKDKGAIKKRLASLIGRGLLLFEEKIYDLHPIVRAYAYDRLKDKKGTHTKLRDYFSAVPAPEKVEKLEDLNPVIELYHHTLKAGDYYKAAELLRDRLANPLYSTFGAYQLYIELLLGLFPDGEDKLPGLKNKSAQAWVLNELANCYGRSGQPRRSGHILIKANEIDEERGEKQGVAIGLGNLMQGQMALGEFDVAKANLQRRMEICQELSDSFREGIGHLELGRLLSYMGDWGEAEKEFNVAQELQKDFPASIGVNWAYRSLAAILQEAFDKALSSALEARKLAGVQYVEREKIQAEWLLGAAYRGFNKLAQAEVHINEALSRCRKINLVELEANILLELARIRRLQKHNPEALTLAQDAIKIANRCEYRLQQGDVRLFLARLALDMGDKAKARIEAQKSLDYASCGYKPTHDKAKDFLFSLDNPA